MCVGELPRVRSTVVTARTGKGLDAGILGGELDSPGEQGDSDAVLIVVERATAPIGGLGLQQPGLKGKGAPTGGRKGAG